MIKQHPNMLAMASTQPSTQIAQKSLTLCPHGFRAEGQLSPTALFAAVLLKLIYGTCAKTLKLQYWANHEKSRQLKVWVSVLQYKLFFALFFFFSSCLSCTAPICYSVQELEGPSKSTLASLALYETPSRVSVVSYHCKCCQVWEKDFAWELRFLLR